MIDTHADGLVLRLMDCSDWAEVAGLVHASTDASSIAWYEQKGKAAIFAHAGTRDQLHSTAAVLDPLASRQAPSVFSAWLSTDSQSADVCSRPSNQRNVIRTGGPDMLLAANFVLPRNSPAFAVTV